MVNIQKASEMLGVKVRTIRQWIREGKIPARKYPISNRWFIDERDIEKLRGNNDNTD